MARWFNFSHKKLHSNSWHHPPASQNHHTLLHQHFRPKLFTQLNIFCRFSSTSRQVNRRCWGPRCRSRTHKTLTGDQDPLRDNPLFQNLTFIFPRFYFLHLQRFARKGGKSRGKLPLSVLQLLRLQVKPPRLQGAVTFELLAYRRGLITTTTTTIGAINNGNN